MADTTAQIFDYKIETEKRDQERKDKLKKKDRKDRKENQRDGVIRNPTTTTTTTSGKLIHLNDVDKKVLEIAQNAS